jgi:hypothetical protein
MLTCVVMYAAIHIDVPFSLAVIAIIGDVCVVHKICTTIIVMSGKWPTKPK